MKSTKLIINIDGPRGVGKTTQIGMLNKFLLDKGLKVNVDTSNQDSSEKIQKSVEMLRSDVDIALNEGSFLRTVAEDLAKGLTQSETIEKNRVLISLNENTRHEFKVLNIVMISDETEGLTKRIEKYNKLTGSDIEIPDHKKEADILNQIIGFENSMATLNADTKLLYVDLNSSMIDVRDDLLEIISSFFLLPS